MGDRAATASSTGKTLVKAPASARSMILLQDSKDIKNFDTDFIIVSDDQALKTPKRVLSQSGPISKTLLSITDTIENARVWYFEVKYILTEKDSITVPTEAERLLSELMVRREDDILAGLFKSRQPDEHRIIFIAKGVGTTMVKECIMRSRVSDDAIRSSIYRNCRGTVLVNPLDAEAISKIRKDATPTGLWPKLILGFSHGTKTRNEQLSIALDETEAIEAAYSRILNDAPSCAPSRFSIAASTPSSVTNGSAWDVLLSSELNKEMEGLKKLIRTTWAQSAPNPSFGQPTVFGRGANLLSIDGGGIKGISSLMILEAIMTKVWEIEHPDQKYGGAQLQLHKHFHLCAGTSTGGLAAIMLFRLQMSVQQTMEAYKNFAKAIFQPTFFGHSFKKLGGFGLWLGNIWLVIKMVFNQARYDAVALENQVNQVVESHNGDETTTLLDPNLAKGDGKMFMCATRTDIDEVAILRSYPTQDPVQKDMGSEMNQIYRDLHPEVKVPVGFEDITICQAARATSAAPTYFPEMVVDSVSFWDGGLLNNNPIDQLWDERFDANEHVTCVLSLGAGRPSRVVLSPFALVNKLKKIMGFITDCEPKAADFERSVRRLNIRRPDFKQVRYFRLNVDTGSEDIDLADYRRMDRLAEYTRAYLDTPEVQGIVWQCAKVLAKADT